MLGNSGAECVAPAATRDVTDGEVGGGWVEHGLDRVRLELGLELGLGLGWLGLGVGLGLALRVEHDLAQLARGGAAERDAVAQQ